MKTRKLYYEDCHLTSFSAKVISCSAVDNGYAVELDATAFYPEGGGQACDIGTLEDVRVLDVQEKGEAVIHFCDGPLTVGAAVTGTIDYDRRFDLMQQHTGEHIVSGVIHRRLGYQNAGFHVGADVLTVDFDGMISQETLVEIEEEANRVVYQNLPLRCWYPEQEELPNIFYRSKRALPWPVRIVQIPQVDSCACCGVHTAYTGEVGLIKLFSCVKFHQGTRIEMACGERARKIMNGIYEQNRLVSQAFSAKPTETGAAAKRVNEALAAEKFRTTGLQRRIFEMTARGYQGQRLALHFEDALTPGQLRELAEYISIHAELAAVVTGSDGAYAVCLAGSGAKPLGTVMAQALQGRGGGKDGFFQGKLSCTEGEIREFFIKHMKNS